MCCSHRASVDRLSSQTAAAREHDRDGQRSRDLSAPPQPVRTRGRHQPILRVPGSGMTGTGKEKVQREPQPGAGKLGDACADRLYVSTPAPAVGVLASRKQAVSSSAGAQTAPPRWAKTALALRPLNAAQGRTAWVAQVGQPVGSSVNTNRRRHHRISPQRPPRAHPGAASGDPDQARITRTQRDPLDRGCFTPAQGRPPANGPRFALGWTIRNTSPAPPRRKKQLSTIGRSRARQ